MYIPPYQPRTDLPHRESLEKGRLKQRREKFIKMEVVTDPVQPAADLPFVPSYESGKQDEGMSVDSRFRLADVLHERCRRAPVPGRV